MPTKTKTSTSCASGPADATPTGAPTSPSTGARWKTRSRSAELRQSRNVTQIQLAAQLGITQGNVSRMEARSEIYLSTLRSYIEALGGHLEITAVFDDDRVPVAVGPREEENSAS